MLECDLEELSATDLLSVAAEFARIQDRAAVRIVEAALAFADQNAVVPGYEAYEPLPGYERIQVFGGDGCPGVAEFAPIELGAVLRMSSGAAAALMGEALALRHRLPRIWAAVLAGNAVAWRARKVAHACLALSLEAAAIVDRRVVGIVNTVTPGALTKIVNAAVWEADPESAKAQAEAAARARGVFVAPSDDQGTKRIWVRAAAGDVIRFDATIDDLARALKTLGDTDSLDQRRAKAIGWIADPAAAHHLLEVARHLAHTQSTHSAPPSDAATPSQPRSAPETPNCANHPSDQPEHSADNGLGQQVEPPAADDRAQARPKPCPGSNENPHAAEGDRAEDGGEAFTRRMLAGELPARLAAIKQDAYRNGLGAGSAVGRRRRNTLYVHLTDRTLATGDGVLRVEELGPLLASQLSELLGHDQVVVKPVIDLHDQVSVHGYEIPDRIRERVRLRHPVDMFPYGGAEATTRMDLDHVMPYTHSDRAAPPGQTRQTGQTGQTGTHNLIPLTRLHHRAKTFGRWRARRLPTGAVEWISPHGFRFVVDHSGTHPLPAATEADPVGG
ncbi:hypothetical protein JOF29_003892 [Kribbella aluminosa]|uniref:DUF222 domain-containing protein n=1 Tax=Kribbella aluminosa TaxID=416017 RepID=A0ABS4UMM7_9ACTN|nr:hypothetical protein [Kribbella aluminosa]MBP2352809.1 hypothetical protein [Kribbella aluminosa]